MPISLAECEKARAVNFMGRLFISADGQKPSPCYAVRIVQSPIEIFPPQYEVLGEQTVPCVDLLTPFHVVGGPFPLPSQETAVRVRFRHKGEAVTESIPIEVVRSSRENLGGGGFPGPFAEEAGKSAAVRHDTVRGFSTNFSFDEAFHSAIANLPRHQSSHPDELEVVRVKEIGAEFGGILGFNHMFVEIERTFS